MNSRRSCLTYALSSFAMGATLVLITSVGTQATDAIDDPVRQPHLKSWSNVIPNASRRFVALADFNNEAVLDRETGLVWEQSPQTTYASWSGALETCINKNVGGRKGWRLPSIPELASLIDPSVAAPGPTLPAGHPFLNLQSSFYWSATTFAEIPFNAWGVNFHNGTVTPGGKPGAVPVWCVRGGMNADQY